MSTTDSVTEPEFSGADPDPQIALVLSLEQAEALRSWLLKSSVNGSTCLDEPEVSHLLTDLGHRVDTIRAASNIRRELTEAGLDVAHLSDDDVRELGRRVSEAAQPGVSL